MKALENHKECPKCGNGHKSKPFCIYENGFHCFSCGFCKSADRSFLLQSKRTNVNVNLNAYIQAESTPKNFTSKCLSWLYQYYLTDEQIYQYGIKCDTTDDSLLFPISETSYMQRWINTKERKIRVFGEKSAILIHTKNTAKQSLIVIVEDYISAIRIASQYNALCLFGTKLTSIDIVKEYDTFVVWLDNDYIKNINSGQNAAKEIREKLNKIKNFNYYKRGFSLTKINNFNIATDKDPKCYTNSQIVNFVEGVLNYE